MPPADKNKPGPRARFNESFIADAEQRILLAQSAVGLLVNDPYIQRRYHRDRSFPSLQALANGKAILGTLPTGRLFMAAVSVGSALTLLDKNSEKRFQGLKAPLKLRLAEAGMALMELHPGQGSEHERFRALFLQKRDEAIASSLEQATGGPRRRGTMHQPGQGRLLI